MREPLTVHPEDGASQPAIRLRPVVETDPENTAEQRSLEKAGFQLEGVVRACEFRAGQWHDGHLYSRLRDDPSPWDRPAG